MHPHRIRIHSAVTASQVCPFAASAREPTEVVRDGDASQVFVTEVVLLTTIRVRKKLSYHSFSGLEHLLVDDVAGVRCGPVLVVGFGSAPLT